MARRNQAFGGEFFADLVHEGGFVGAKAAPGGPEFEQRHFAFDRRVGEFFAGGGCRGKARSGFLFVRGRGKAQGGEEHGDGECAAEEDGSHAHGQKIAQIGEQGLEDRDWGLGLGTETLGATPCQRSAFFPGVAFGGRVC